MLPYIFQPVWSYSLLVTVADSTKLTFVYYFALARGKPDCDTFCKWLIFLKSLIYIFQYTMMTSCNFRFVSYAMLMWWMDAFCHSICQEEMIKPVNSTVIYYPITNSMSGKRFKHFLSNILFEWKQQVVLVLCIHSCAHNFFLPELSSEFQW